MRTTHRGVAALAAPVLVLSGLASGQSASAASDPTPSATASGTWLVSQLTSGVVHNDQFAFDDYGLTTDVGLALAELGGQPTALASVAGAMATHVHDYTEPGFGTDISAGGTAKVLRLAQVTGGDPRSFGGVDLVSRLETLTGGNGRIADDTTTPADDDFANVIGQSFAVQGLTVAGSPEAAAAAGFLVAQQCSAGWFRLNFSPAVAADQSCNGASPVASPDTDVTALAVLALQSRRTDPAAAAAVAKAVAWLKSVQLANGSFGGGTSTDTPNANSTGLAAAALGAECAVAAADKGADWVRTLQVPTGQTGPLATSVGAVAYDPAAKADGVANGITVNKADQWRRATSQAALGLVWDDTAPATVQVTGPTGFVKAGDTVKVTITGAAAGERVCVTEPNGVRALTGTGSPLTVDVKTPKKGDAVVSATTGPGASSATVKTLAKARLKPKLAKTVARGDKVSVRLKGLGAKEKVKVFVDGKVVAKGKASKKGVFVGRFVARLKVGAHKLKVTGEFKNRVGTATFRVVP
jgi:hypothetical protein